MVSILTEDGLKFRRELEPDPITKEEYERDPDSFSIKVTNNLIRYDTMPFWVPPCGECYRTTMGDDVDVQVVGYHKEFCSDTGSEYDMPDYMCKDCRVKFNKPALSSYKKEDIGKRKTFIVNGGTDIEYDPIIDEEYERDPDC